MIRFPHGPFFENPGDLLPPGGNPPPEPRGRRGPIVCEHCECQLTPTGDVLRMSDTARKHLKSAETQAKLEEKIAALETELREARAQIETLTPRASGPKIPALEF